jgi:hypothetical protein
MYRYIHIYMYIYTYIYIHTHTHTHTPRRKKCMASALFEQSRASASSFSRSLSFSEPRGATPGCKSELEKTAQHRSRTSPSHSCKSMYIHVYIHILRGTPCLYIRVCVKEVYKQPRICLQIQVVKERCRASAQLVHTFWPGKALWIEGPLK